ncbi:MAG: hypothetical protein OMM_13856, partial [Candidatus Magnetoglobus multicellularis str. Araruama]
FSFGDYFKREAIQFHYRLLTEIFGLPKDRLAVTVFSNDDEAYQIWSEEIGIDPKRIVRMGHETNFWRMGDTGPCGPTSEVMWDQSPHLGVDTIIPGIQADEDRFLEICNLVFMQFNRTKADPEESGRYDTPLPAPGIDTGMGFERITSVIQGVTSNYETDIFMPIIDAIQKLSGTTTKQKNENIIPYRVIADHIRAATFLITDGILPGAKGRESVCRLVIRRASRFGFKLGLNEPFLAKLSSAVIEIMGEHYTELFEHSDFINEVLTREELRFQRTLEHGINELEEELNALKSSGQNELSGEKSFNLKATHGLPIQVIQDIAKERNFTVDIESFAKEERKHSKISGGGQAMGYIDAADNYKNTFAILKSDNVLTDT